MVQVADMIEEINSLSEKNKLFWVAGLAREIWPILVPHKDELNEIALMAVEHYEALA